MSIKNHQQIKGISDCSRGDIDTKEILEEDIYLFLKIWKTKYGNNSKKK